MGSISGKKKMLTEFFDMVITQCHEGLMPVCSSQTVYEGTIVVESWLYNIPPGENKELLKQTLEQGIDMMMQQKQVVLPNCPNQRQILIGERFAHITYMYV